MQPRLSQNHTWVKDSLKVQDGQMIFNISEYGKLIFYGFRFCIATNHTEMIIYCVLVCFTNEEYWQLSEKSIKNLLPFPTANLCEATCFSHTSDFNQNNILNAEADKSGFLLNQILNRFPKCKTMTLSYKLFFVCKYGHCS